MSAKIENIKTRFLEWWQRARKWIRSHWRPIAGALAVALILAIICWWIWGSVGEETKNKSETLRNLALVGAAIIGLPLAIWRSMVAHSQAKTAERGLLNERYQKGAEMLGSAILSVRLSGIYAMGHLAQERPGDYHVSIMDSLCAFIRHPTEDKAFPEQQSQDGEQEWVRPDVETAAQAIGRCRESEEAKAAEEKTNNWKLDLRSANLTSAALSRANLSRANLSEAHLSDADLSDAKLSGADLSSADLTGADLTDAILTDASLIGADLVGAILTGAHLTGADLLGAVLTGADLSGANLTGAVLFKAKLTDADLREANLTGADLNHTDLTRVNVSDADLSSAKLLGANLSVANFSSAYLLGARLTGANLTRAFLADANLSDANLARADLLGAVLIDANLSGTENLTQGQLNQALPTEPAQNLPQGLEWPFEEDDKGEWELKPRFQPDADKQ